MRKRKVEEFTDLVYNACSNLEISYVVAGYKEKIRRVLDYLDLRESELETWQYEIIKEIVFEFEGYDII